MIPVEKAKIYARSSKEEQHCFIPLLSSALESILT